jgi:hypothetical protein
MTIGPVAAAVTLLATLIVAPVAPTTTLRRTVLVCGIVATIVVAVTFDLVLIVLLHILL